MLMKNNLAKNYKKFSNLKNKQTVLKRFFNVFLSEAVYRNTKMEHPNSSKKDIFSFLK